MEIPFERLSVRLPQGEVEYHDVGEGPVLVFLSAALTDARYWWPVAEQLASQFRCILPHLPLGAHRIPLDPAADVAPSGVAELVRDLLAALDLRDVTLIGSDSGGALSQMIAASGEPRVQRMVLCPCDAFEVFPPAQFGYFKVLPRIPGAMFMMAWSMTLFPVLMRLPIAFGRLLTPPRDVALLKSWFKPMRTNRKVRRDLKKFALGLDAKLTMDAAKTLEMWPHPVLLIWADADIFPLSLGRRLHDNFPNSTLQIVEDTTALIPMEQPDAVAQAIAKFVPRSASSAVA